MTKKLLRLTENKLKKVVKDAAISIIKENGLIHNDELMEYARLRKKNTGINVDIYVDDGGAYKRYGHPLWVYVRNGHDIMSPFFHIEVSNNPILPNIKYNISEMELQSILTFISVNAQLLEAFANDEVEHEDFYKLCKPIICNYTKDDIDEMSTLKPKTSGLPTILWIDEGSHPQHGPRIKFQASKDQVLTSNYSSMSISQEPEIFNPPKKFDLNKKELERIIDFVKLNEIYLLAVADGSLTFEDFLKVMVKT